MTNDEMLMGLDEHAQRYLTVRIGRVNGRPTSRYAVVGWDNIAGVLNRSVPTVRRYQADEGLPVVKDKASGRVWIWWDDLCEWAGDRGLL